jgi:hypothetical protein
MQFASCVALAMSNAMLGVGTLGVGGLLWDCVTGV